MRYLVTVEIEVGATSAQAAMETAAALLLWRAKSNVKSAVLMPPQSGEKLDATRDTKGHSYTDVPDGGWVA